MFSPSIPLSRSTPGNDMFVDLSRLPKSLLPWSMCRFLEHQNRHEVLYLAFGRYSKYVNVFVSLLVRGLGV
jgi:hypothetical protein